MLLQSQRAEEKIAFVNKEHLKTGYCFRKECKLKRVYIFLTDGCSAMLSCEGVALVVYMFRDANGGRWQMWL